MPAQKPTKEQCTKAIAMIEKCDGNVTRAAQKLKMPRTTLMSWVKFYKTGEFGEALTRQYLLDDLVERLKRNGVNYTHDQYANDSKHGALYRKHWKGFGEFKAEAMEKAGITIEVISAREKQRFQDQIEQLKNNTRALLRELNQAEDLRSSVFKLTEQDTTPPDWVINIVKAAGTPGIPILFASDFQFGEVISKEELDGINEYNSDIAEKRYRVLIERTIELSFEHMVRPQYNGIVYLRGGDMISGDIHQELRETNDLKAIPAVVRLTKIERWGIEQLAKAFGHVWVITVPGNHGRTTEKPHAKEYAQRNYDYLSGLMLESHFENDLRVRFWTPLSGDALFDVVGWRFLLTHGDRIGASGGQGFIGPSATIARGMKKLIDYYAGLGQMIDYVFVGHFHTRLELEYGFANGSLSGYSEYAKRFRMKPQVPSQWLVFVHPKWGVTARWPILLEARSRLSKKAVAAFQPVDLGQ